MTFFASLPPTALAMRSPARTKRSGDRIFALVGGVEDAAQRRNVVYHCPGDVTLVSDERDSENTLRMLRRRNLVSKITFNARDVIPPSARNVSFARPSHFPLVEQ